MSDANQTMIPDEVSERMVLKRLAVFSLVSASHRLKSVAISQNGTIGKLMKPENWFRKEEDEDS